MLVAGVAVVGGVDQAQEVARQRRGEVPARGDDERHALAAHVGVLADDAEHEGCGEGRHSVLFVRAVEAQRSGVEGVPLQRGGAVGEHEQAVRRDCGHAVEGEVRAGEAVEGERRLLHGGHEVVERDEEEEECRQHGLIRFTASSLN